MRERDQEIKRRRHRKAKLAKLRGQFAAATTAAEKQEIAAKIHRVSIYAPVELV
ncbi:DUF6800 family protein [Candidatus Cyanaurora vandensis]|uniref:DUF6800 family protein n=1 Tax=Candidatus Cyanaurora vandensis TaxID=2714958 RepID=UPI00257D1D3B|nr:DUF6800 family protein [Candidatus Cyanaurora vandensis]